MHTVLVFFCPIFVAQEKSKVYLFVDNVLGLNLFIHLLLIIYLKLHSQPPKNLYHFLC